LLVTMSSLARENERTESPMSALNRRVIIFVILALVVFTQVAPVLFHVETVVPTVREGFSLLGIDIAPDEIEYVTVKGMLKLDEAFSWATLIIEFYFGAQLMKGGDNEKKIYISIYNLNVSYGERLCFL